MNRGIRLGIGLVTAVVIALALGLGVTYLPLGPQSTISKPTTSSTFSSEYSNSSTSQSLSTPCSSPAQNVAQFFVNESSNLFLCVRFYYYSSGSPLQVIPTNQLSIDANRSSALITGPSQLRSAMSNFTLSSSPANFSIGGSSNENEGILVEYLIHADVNSNGSYILNLGWLVPQVENCWSEFGLVVGNGIPNYYNGGTCYTVSQTSSSYQYPAGTLFVGVVGYST